MDTWVWIVIGVVVAIVVLGVLASASALRARRSRSLQDRFGREDERNDESARDRELEDVHAHDNVKRLR